MSTWRTNQRYHQAKRVSKKGGRLIQSVPQWQPLRRGSGYAASRATREQVKRSPLAIPDTKSSRGVLSCFVKDNSVLSNETASPEALATQAFQAGKQISVKTNGGLQPIV